MQDSTRFERAEPIKLVGSVSTFSLSFHRELIFVTAVSLPGEKALLEW